MKNLFQKRVLTQIGFIFGVMAVFTIAIVFLGSNISRTSQVIAAKNLELASNLNAIRDLARLRQESQNAEAFIQRLNQLIPTRDGLFSFANYLRSLALRDNLSSNFKFGDEAVVSGDFKTIRFNLTVQGLYFDISRYVADLESAPYIISIDNFSSIGQLDRHIGTIDGSVLFKER